MRRTSSKLLLLIIVLIVIVSLFTVPAISEENIKVILDGTELVFDVPPQIINGRTMVPMRTIFEAMGADVNWDDATKSVTATKDDIIIIMQIGNDTVSINGNDITLDVPPQLVDSRTLVPARAVAEGFNADVNWDAETRTVIITTGVEHTEDTENLTNATGSAINDEINCTLDVTIYVMDIAPIGTDFLSRALISVYDNNGKEITSSLTFGNVEFTKGTEVISVPAIDKEVYEYKFASNWQVGETVDVIVDVQDSNGKLFRLSAENVKVKGFEESLQDLLGPDVEIKINK